MAVQGLLNKTIAGNLSNSSNDALYIELSIPFGQKARIYSINWGYSHISAPLPTTGNFSYGTLKIIRNAVYDPNRSYVDGFGSNFKDENIQFMDVITGNNSLTGYTHFLSFDTPLELKSDNRFLIVVSNVLTNDFSTIGAFLSVNGAVVSEDGVSGPSLQSPVPRRF